MAVLLHVTQTYGHGLATCCVRTHPSLTGVTFRAQGNFVVREKNARKGRNPQTGQEILLDARRVLTFKPSLVLKNVLNETEVTDEDRAAEARQNAED